jgi:hypothetical protein
LIILPAQVPPAWVSYIKAGLVIATADSLPYFSAQMLQNWLICSGSGFTKALTYNSSKFSCSYLPGF